MIRIRKKQKGDTIIEVLISLAILTAVLGGAYYTANLSFRNDQSSQEHTQALTIAQTQIEDLRIYGSGFPGADQCLTINSNKIAASTACKVPSNNSAQYVSRCPSGAPFCYTVDLSKVNSVTLHGVTLNTFQVNVNWPALGGGQNDVTLYYRVDS